MQSPRYNNLDVSLVKITPIHDQVQLELRAEAFNAYNAQILGSPGTTIGTSGAGFVTSLTSTPRQLQMSAKVTFLGFLPWTAAAKCVVVAFHDTQPRS